MIEMNVLVTGNKGYVGTVLTRMLLERGHAVTGLDTGYYDGCHLSDFKEPERQLRRDIRDVRAEDLDGIDAIIHLAALSNDPVGELDPKLTGAINHEATVRLAELAMSRGIARFVYASSCSLYGVAGDDPLDESAPMAPVTAYAKSKVASEEALRKWGNGRFQPVYLRPATVYGVSPMQRLDIVLNNLVGWASATGRIKIMSDGTPWRPAVHVEDLCQAFILALEAPAAKVSNQAFNVGSNEQNYQVRQMADAVSAVVPNCETEYTGEHGADSRTYIVNFDKIRNVLGFRPQWDISTGTRQLHEAFRKAGLTEEELNGYRFIRLNQIKRLLEEGKIDEYLHWKGK